MHAPIARKVASIVYFIGLTAALAGLLFGLDVGVISGAQQFIQKEFSIPDWTLESIVSALLLGAVFGTLVSGYLSSHFGRRKTILISALIFTVGSLLCAVAPSADILIAARFFLALRWAWPPSPRRFTCRRFPRKPSADR